ncbi:hypothetical protein PAMA_004999 [Pampus argenteus]
MSSPGGRGLVECEEGEEVRWGERKSVPWGVSSQTHLKELYFSERGEREAEELSGAASLKKGSRAQASHANPYRGHTPAPRQTAYYPTCREVIALAERKAVENHTLTQHSS